MSALNALCLMGDLILSLSDVYQQFGFKPTYWVAYSGGLDSHVLLSLCHQFSKQYPINLRAIHLNHGLSPYANKWQDHCKEVCKQYEIEFIEDTLHLDLSNGESLEEVAREKRYSIFKQLLAQGDILLTAHHQDDQAETVLLQLLRGAGPKGLAAMPAIKPFGRGSHVRPLLKFSRQILENHAQQYQLNFIRDESNQDTRFTRNFIRHEILNLLKSRWPSVLSTLSRTAQHCAEMTTLHEKFALEMMETMSGANDNTISIAKLLAFDTEKQKLVLRTWIQQNGYRLPSSKKLSVILNNVLQAKIDRQPCVSWNNVAIRRYRDELYLVRIMEKKDRNNFTWHLSQPLNLDWGILQANQVVGKGLRSDLSKVIIKFRQGGETLRVGKHHRTLKNFFQENGVLPWLRDRIPLLFDDETLICVVGYFMDERYKAKINEKGWEIVFINHV